MALSFSSIAYAGGSVIINTGDPVLNYGFSFEKGNLVPPDNHKFNVATSPDGGTKEFWQEDEHGLSYHSLKKSEGGKFNVVQTSVHKGKDFTNVHQQAVEYSSDGKLLEVIDCSQSETFVVSGFGGSGFQGKNVKEDKCSYYTPDFCKEITEFDLDKEVEKQLKACNNIIEKIAAIYEKTFEGFNKAYGQKLQGSVPSLQKRASGPLAKKVDFGQESGIDGVRKGFTDVVNDQQACKRYKDLFPSAKKEKASQSDAEKSKAQRQ